jgi:cell division protein FtsQ
VLLGVLAIAVFSPILALRTIRVEGTHAVSAADVSESLDNQLGTPLALLNDNAIAKDLGKFVLIKSYVTEIVPPNTLVVRVVERSAIGVIQDGDVYDQVDPAGVIVATSAKPSGLPVIEIGSTKARGAGFDAAVKVLLAMPQSVFVQVKTISATTLDNVSLTLKTGSHVVLWGSSAQSALKAQDLAEMLSIHHCETEPVLNVTAPLVLGCGPAQSTPKPTSTPTSTPTP